MDLNDSPIEAQQIFFGVTPATIQVLFFPNHLIMIITIIEKVVLLK